MQPINIESTHSSHAPTAIISDPQPRDLRLGLLRIRNFAQLHSLNTRQALATLPEALKTEENKAQLIGKPHPKAIVAGWKYLLDKNVATPDLLSAIASHPHPERLNDLLEHLRKQKYWINQNVIKTLTKIALTDEAHFTQLYERFHQNIPFISHIPPLFVIVLKHPNPIKAMDAYAILCSFRRADGLPLARQALKSKRPDLTALVLEVLRRNERITPDNIIRSIHHPEMASEKFQNEGWDTFYKWFKKLPTEAPCSP